MWAGAVHHTDLSSNETLKRTSAKAMEVIVVVRLARLSLIQHRFAGELSLAA